MHVHDQAVHSMQAHVDGQSHDHWSMHAMAMADDDDQSLMSAAMDGNETSKKASHRSGGQCCAQMSVSAMPAALVDFAMPSVPTSVFVATGYRAMADNAPAVHYRPPIA